MKQRSLRSSLFRLVGILAIQTILILVGGIFVSVSLFQRTIIERQYLLINSLVNQGNLFLINTEQVMASQARIIREFSLSEQSRILQQLKEEYPRFASLQLIDPSGLVIAESADTRSLLSLDLSGEPFFEEVQSSKTAHFSDPFISLTTGDTALIVAVPILESAELKGILTGEISLALLQAEVIEQANLGEETVSFIVDGQGRLLAHPNQEWVQERRNLANMPLVEAGLNGAETIDLFYDEVQDKWMVGTVQTMINGWPVLTIQPVSIAARPIMILLAVAGFAFLVSASLFVMVVSR
ncbi:MAG: cache domain-containing protein, partial [Anaerolineales bacterium]|nr:cache domain-containing protein [Anaerolineales bacterium]